MSIKRYQHFVYPENEYRAAYSDAEECKDGDWVRYEDHRSSIVDTIKSTEILTLNALINAMREKLGGFEANNAISVIREMQNDVAKQQNQCPNP